MPYAIRPARPEEFETVADVCVAAYAPFLADDHRYVAVLRDVARRAEAAELLVAAGAGGRIHGTVTFVPDGVGARRRAARLRPRLGLAVPGRLCRR